MAENTPTTQQAGSNPQKLGIDFEKQEYSARNTINSIKDGMTKVRDAERAAATTLCSTEITAGIATGVAAAYKYNKYKEAVKKVSNELQSHTQKLIHTLKESNLDEKFKEELKALQENDAHIKQYTDEAEKAADKTAKKTAESKLAEYKKERAKLNKTFLEKVESSAKSGELKDVFSQISPEQEAALVKARGAIGYGSEKGSISEFLAKQEVKDTQLVKALQEKSDESLNKLFEEYKKNNKNAKIKVLTPEKIQEIIKDKKSSPELKRLANIAQENDVEKNIQRILARVEAKESLTRIQNLRKIVDDKGYSIAQKALSNSADAEMAAAIKEGRNILKKGGNKVTKILRNGKVLGTVGGVAALGLTAMGANEVVFSKETEDALHAFNESVAKAEYNLPKRVESPGTEEQKQAALDYCIAHTADPQEKAKLEAIKKHGGSFFKVLVETHSDLNNLVHSENDSYAGVWKQAAMDEMEKSINNQFYADLIQIHQTQTKQAQTNLNNQAVQSTTGTQPQGEKAQPEEQEKKTEEEKKVPEDVNSKSLGLAIAAKQGDLEDLQRLIGEETDPEKIKLLQEKEKALTAELKGLEEMKAKLEGLTKGEEARKAEKEKEEEKGKEGAKEKGKGGSGNVGSGNAGTDGLSGALSGMNPQRVTGNGGTSVKPDDAAIQQLMSGAQPAEEQKGWWERNMEWILWTLGGLALATVGILGFRKGGWWNKDKKENTTTTTTPATNATDTTSGTTESALTNNQNGSTGSTLENSAIKVNTDIVEQLNNALSSNTHSL